MGFAGEIIKTRYCIENPFTGCSYRNNSFGAFCNYHGDYGKCEHPDATKENASDKKLKHK